MFAFVFTQTMVWERDHLYPFDKYDKHSFSPETFELLIQVLRLFLC